MSPEWVSASSAVGHEEPSLDYRGNRTHIELAQSATSGRPIGPAVGYDNIDPQDAADWAVSVGGAVVRLLAGEPLTLGRQDG